MTNQNKFRRYEIKYLINSRQRDYILTVMSKYMVEDSHGRSTINNIYYDTESFLLIRRSIDKPMYKEKVRVRSYGKASIDSPVFIELKKKYEDVVYKRRFMLTEQQAMAYFNNTYKPKETQIVREISYAKDYYEGITPKMMISYERDAFYGKDDANFRITFDHNILWRTNDISLCSDIYGYSLLDDDQYLMEIKTTGAIPLWLVKVLSENHIYKTSFSKYGMAYQTYINFKGEINYE